MYSIMGQPNFWQYYDDPSSFKIKNLKKEHVKFIEGLLKNKKSILEDEIKEIYLVVNNIKDAKHKMLCKKIVAELYSYPKISQINYTKYLITEELFIESVPLKSKKQESLRNEIVDYISSMISRSIQKFSLEESEELLLINMMLIKNKLEPSEEILRNIKEIYRNFTCDISRLGQIFQKDAKRIKRNNPLLQ